MTKMLRHLKGTLYRGIAINNLLDSASLLGDASRACANSAAAPSGIITQHLGLEDACKRPRVG